MKLASYWKGDECRAALLDGEQLFDLHDSLKAAGAPAPVSDLKQFLSQQDWKGSLELLRERGKRSAPVALASVRLAAPIPQPGKLIMAGANTFTHLKEAEPLVGNIPPSLNPMVLGKATSSVTGPNDDIILPPETKKLDYEVEIGIVIGKTCRRQPENAVKDYIAGFLAMNDVSARDVQLAEGETATFYRTHFVGKSFDTFAPMGPAITTVDELEWGKPLRMRTFVNGELRQDGDTTDLCHGIERLVSYVSSAMTLHPGDIISSGTPAGVAYFRDPPVFLTDGDVVICEVEGVGRVENRVRNG